MQRLFVSLFVAVSALGASAVALVRTGLHGGGAGWIVGGGVAAAIAAVGVVALARMVLVSERARKPR